MIRSLRSQPYFIVLLPVFFVLHGFLEHFGFINAGDVLMLALVYLVVTALLYFFCRLIFRSRIKAALVAGALMAFYLFFGALYDFAKAHAPVPFFYKYSFLIGGFLVLFLAFFFFLKRSGSSFQRLTLFLNILLIIYLVVDLAGIGWKAAHPLRDKLATYDFAKDNTSKIPDSCKKPDIYFLLFDEYAGSRSLKERFGFDNSDMDSFFVANHFRLQTNSRSNYGMTPFSMASTLNMKYIEGVDPRVGVSREDILSCNRLIRDNEVIKFLGMNGYEIVNLSVFDLAGHPAVVDQTFLPVRSKMITEGTLFPRIYRDFEWLFVNNRFFARFIPNRYAQHVKNNEYFLQTVRSLSAVQQQQPRFVYAHFYMPHFPFFFDRYGNRRPDSTLLRELEDLNGPAYLDYLLYTNGEIKKLVQTIQANSRSTAAIMVMSDHGLRWTEQDSLFHLIFQNLNAVYLPGGRYDQFYDSITNVNQFRIVFNTLFRQQFPLLKDSTILLKDKR